MPAIRFVCLLLFASFFSPVLSQPSVQLGPDTTICIGTSLNLLPSITSSGPVSYLWQNGTTFSSFNADTAGWYWVEVSDLSGSARDSIYISLRHPPKPLQLGPDTFLCPGDSILLDAHQPEMFYFWQDNSNDSVFWVESPGQYAVIINNICGAVSDTIEINQLLPPAAFSLGRDSSLCQGDTLLLSVGQGNASLQFLWQNGSIDSVFSIGSSGLYYSTISNLCGSVRDSLVATFLNPPLPFSLGADTSLCEGDSILLSHQETGMQYVWQDGRIDTFFWASSDGSYHLELRNQCGVERDTILLDFLAWPVAFDLGPDSILCKGQGLLFDIAQSDARYLWSDSSSFSLFSVMEAGTYWGMAYNQCGSFRDSIEVGILEGPDPFVLGNDTVLCTGEIIQLDATQPEGSYLWSTDDTTASITVGAAGVYWVEVSNRCELELDNILIEYLDPPYPFSLGADSTICWLTELALDASAGQPPAQYLWQDGSTDPVYFVRFAGEYSVFLANKCGTATDTIEVDTLSAPPMMDLGADTTSCLEDFPFIGQVRISRSDLNLRWDNGDQIPIRWVADTGRVWLELSNRCGVSFSERHVYGVDCDCTVYMGNAFTPNNDGHNDFFGPVQHCDLRQIDFQIYNRWGERVFVSQSADQYWDGTQNGIPCPEGVYVWLLQYTGAEKGKVLSVPMRGSVSLWR